MIMRNRVFTKYLINRHCVIRSTKINPYKPRFLFVGHRQTVKNQRAASDQVLYCLLTEVSFEIRIK